jgi:hypothetical protein
MGERLVNAARQGRIYPQNTGSRTPGPTSAITITGPNGRGRFGVVEPGTGGGHTLSYRIECNPTMRFENPPAVEKDTPDFHLLLRDGIATFQFKQHYADVEEAQRGIASFLRAWEIDFGLTTRPGEVRFVYEDAKISDREPPQPGVHRVIGRKGGVVLVRGGRGGMVIVSRSAYPEPPTEFYVDPTVETLWHRYEGHVAGHEPLSSMAYFCLTVLESSAQETGRRGAAKQYAIDHDVLKKLGELTADRGDPMTARKMGSTLKPHTPVELEWIVAVVKLIIRRAAEFAAGASLTPVNMADLPRLPAR